MAGQHHASALPINAEPQIWFPKVFAGFVPEIRKGHSNPIGRTILIGWPVAQEKRQQGWLW
ncbi:hypothetical protein, partial [Hoeflea sp.]|uniref:hypothetical protein n=1 Tax=Hoeflea sp. TaxID=1940281 RepID=UPI002AFE6B71